MESGIWVRLRVRLRARVCGKHFLCRNAAIGKEAERMSKGFTPAEIVMIVSAFC